MREMLAVAEEHKKKRLRVALISDIYTASTEDQAQKCIALIPQEKGKHWYVLLVISRLFSFIIYLILIQNHIHNKFYPIYAHCICKNLLRNIVFWYLRNVLHTYLFAIYSFRYI